MTLAALIFLSSAMIAAFTNFHRGNSFHNRGLYGDIGPNEDIELRPSIDPYPFQKVAVLITINCLLIVHPCEAATLFRNTNKVRNRLETRELSKRCAK